MMLRGGFLFFVSLFVIAVAFALTRSASLAPVLLAVILFIAGTAFESSRDGAAGEHDWRPRPRD